jgi:two-component system, LuxR family, sensor histidine kinase DctS
LQPQSYLHRSMRLPALHLTRRGVLWAALLLLVASLLATLIWLAGRYEVSQVQERLERDAALAVTDIRTALTRNVQSLQALQTRSAPSGQWAQETQTVLRDRREILQIELRDKLFNVRGTAQSPYLKPVAISLSASGYPSDIQAACSTANRITGPAYSATHFQPMGDGLGAELIEVCLPLSEAGQVAGYLVATYSLGGILAELINKQITREQEVSLTEADGTRLAIHGSARRGSRVFTTQQLLDLPGNTLVVRMDSWRAAPDLFPNVLTALVTLMSLALMAVLVLLGKDVSRRLRAERELAEALAFRKAMEDSLVTGMRARDLQGRITYVNPAFCQMTGFGAQDLVGVTSPMPYWPPELADEYQQRQTVRLTGQLPTREGFESVFIRKDGSRFPVLIIEAPLINAAGAQTGWMSAILDMTDQRRMEELSRASLERLQASARLATVGEMASLLSHELNQPLAAISSYATGSLNMLLAPTATLLNATPKDPENLKIQDMVHALKRIGEQAERAGKVIKSVHDFVRRRDQAHEALAPAALFEAVMPLVSLQARKLGVRVQVHCDSRLPKVLCDRTMVEQVLLNLARNAMQAMEDVPLHERVLDLRANAPKRSSGALEADPPMRSAELPPASRWMEFTVTDQGSGIDTATAERLFTPFFTTKSEGMGLGLSMCRTVVEQHGGFLAFEAVKPRGTVFKFTLPVATSDLNAQQLG